MLPLIERARAIFGPHAPKECTEQVRHEFHHLDYDDYDFTGGSYDDDEEEYLIDDDGS